MIRKWAIVIQGRNQSKPCRRGIYQKTQAGTVCEQFIVSCRHLWRGTQPLSHRWRRWLLLLLLLLPSSVAVARQLDLSCRVVQLPAPGERPAAPHAACPGHRRRRLGLGAVIRVIDAASFLAAQLKGGVRRKDEPPIWLHDEDCGGTMRGRGGREGAVECFCSTSWRLVAQAGGL